MEYLPSTLSWDVISSQYARPSYDKSDKLCIFQCHDQLNPMLLFALTMALTYFMEQRENDDEP
jgi:hypothetical protein